MSVKLNQNQYFQASRKKKWCGKNEEIQENSDQVGSYFLASRNMHLIPVRSYCSIFFRDYELIRVVFSIQKIALY